MHSMTLGLRVSGVFFAVICLGHLLRLVTLTPIMLASFSVPVWISAVAAIVTGVLAAWLWSLTAGGSQTKPSNPAT